MGDESQRIEQMQVFEYEDDCAVAKADRSEGRFLFSSPLKPVSAQDLERIPTGPTSYPAEILAAAREALNRSPHTDPAARAIVGAIPFTRHSPACLFVSDSLSDLHSSAMAPADYVPAVVPLANVQITSVPRPEEYELGVARALEMLERGPIEKIVLARTLELVFQAPVDVPALIATVARRNPTSFAFSLPFERDGVRHTFVGASPELLIRKTGMTVATNPLAGSIRRGATPEEDEKNARTLMDSAKDLHEHEIVIAAVRQALEPFCSELNIPASPSLIKTPTLWHLSTAISGQLNSPTVSSLELALALHPTPAVCGHPTSDAFQAIGAIEPFERGLYAGFVGWNDGNGDGEWAVTIRCAEIREQWVRLYAGAGIVKGSQPKAERAETEAKLRTMLLAFGIHENFSA